MLWDAAGGRVTASVGTSTFSFAYQTGWEQQLEEKKQDKLSTIPVAAQTPAGFRSTEKKEKKNGRACR